MPKLLINLTTAKNDTDKTTVAFVVANAGIAAGQIRPVSACRR